MDILKAFKLIDEEFIINIQGTLENPIFQANQIGHILGISNIRESIRDYDDEEKVVILADTNKGKHKTNFLTELGLYRLLGKSNKPIANIFQKWMIKILKEIRLNGIYQLKNENEIDRKLLEFNCDLKNHQIILKTNSDKNIVYIFNLIIHFVIVFA